MIVVTGATGNVGRELVRQLAAEGEEVVAVSRRPASPGAPVGVRHAQADTGDSAGLRPVLDGADAVFLVIGGELNSHGESPYALLKAIADAGAGRVVLLTSRLVSTRPHAPSHARLREYEAAVRDAGPEFTILRPGGFASNTLAWADAVRAERTVSAPFGDVALPVIDPADIAAVAAATLREDGHAGRAYELTGPVAVTPREQTAAIAEALGEEVTFVELSREQAHARLARFLPEEIIDGTLDALGAPTPAEQRVSPEVERILHRPAAPYTAWLARSLPAFR